MVKKHKIVPFLITSYVEFHMGASIGPILGTFYSIMCKSFCIKYIHKKKYTLLDLSYSRNSIFVTRELVP